MTFREGDAEHLPFPDEAFDVVLSTFGVMFAPDQAQAARELLRVCRPGGKVGLANWPPDGLTGQGFRITAEYVPPPPGVPPPTLWGLRRGSAPSLGQASRRSTARGAVSFSATAQPNIIWSTFGRTLVPRYAPSKGCLPSGRSASVVPCWRTYTDSINQAMRLWWFQASISKSSPPKANPEGQWGHLRSLPSPAPNQALHLTASSLRSCLASASGSR